MFTMCLSANQDQLCFCADTQDMLEHPVLPAERDVALLLSSAPRSAVVALAARLREDAAITSR
jgi:hypothetical protein